MTASPPPARVPAAALGTNPAAALWQPAPKTAHEDGWDRQFVAGCPTPGCGRDITWTDSVNHGPRPGACDCEIERNVA